MFKSIENDPQVVKLRGNAVGNAAPPADDWKVAPLSPTVDLTTAPPQRISELRALGLENISKGKTALVLMAGGQGTRLGSQFPKGVFDLGLPSGRTLFQLIGERIVRLRQVAAEAAALAIGASADEAKASSLLPSIPWYIMTSEATLEVTKAYLEHYNYFGLPPSDVVVFEQGLLPAMTVEGKIIMELASKPALSPNGNGGLYAGLAKGKLIEDMQKRGVGT